MTQETICIGIISSILSVLIISIFLRLQMFILLFKLSGKNYHGFGLDGSIYKGKNYSVSFNVWKQVLTIRQKSEKKGDWISKIYLSRPNILHGIGNFKYTTVYPDNWGTHSVIINLEEKIIHIHTKSKMFPTENIFLIKKITA